jgi:predicted CXXCH cytochrome family protein
MTKPTKASENETMRWWPAIFLGVMSLMLWPTSSEADIRNSKHDLTVGSIGPSDSSLLGGTDPCIYCHAPHDPGQPEQKPLWNRSNPASKSFIMYGTTMSGNTTDAQPNPASLRCLSCHDGMTAVDAYGGSNGTPGKTLGTPYAIGASGDLSDDHPVSITALGMDKSIASAEAVGLVFYKSAGVKKVECPTCHDPHRTDNNKFLRMSNNRSALCLTCHDK